MCVHVYTTCIYKNILEPVYITFPLRLSPHHPRKQKNGPYEGKVVGGQETSQVFSVIDQWPLCEEGVFSHNVLH